GRRAAVRRVARTDTGSSRAALHRAGAVAAGGVAGGPVRGQGGAGQGARRSDRDGVAGRRGGQRVLRRPATGDPRLGARARERPWGAHAARVAVPRRGDRLGDGGPRGLTTSQGRSATTAVSGSPYMIRRGSPGTNPVSRSWLASTR